MVESHTQWIEGLVASNIHWTPNLFSLRIEADVAPFAAGQYTSLALDIGGVRIAQPDKTRAARAARTRSSLGRMGNLRSVFGGNAIS
jgi:ferredoxin--NADP+ reductase